MAATTAVTTAVVTGGASGLGRALVLALAKGGADVVIADLHGPRMDETVAAVTALGRQAIAVPTDVRDAGQVEALLETAVQRLGGVDLWANNAGVAGAGDVGDGSLDDWRFVLDVNLWGVIHGCHAVAPYMKKRGKGIILNTASAAGLISSPHMGAYNASKAAVVAITETLYGELAGTGVRTTVVCPTFFQTNLLESARMPDGRNRKFATKLMQRSSWTADDVARVALADAYAGRLYSVAMSDGRWLWRARRLWPQMFYDRMAAIAKRV